MVRKHIFLTEQLVKRLARAKKLNGVNMGEIIRRAIDEYLTGIGV